jgi:PrsW family intramembrane metalloprotease
MEEKITTLQVHRPGTGEMLFFCLSGIIVSIPFTLFFGVFSSHLCFFLPLLYSEICTSGIFAPFIEEFAKAFPLFYRHGETERSIFTLGFLTGLGFGITEFFFYVFGQGAPVIVRLPGIFFHAASASIIAYGIAAKRPMRYYLVAVFLHLAYNILAFSGALWLVGGSADLIITYYLSWHLYKNTSERFY